MGVRVTRLELTAHDGRDALVVEVDDAQHTRLTCYGTLYLDAQTPRPGQALCWDLLVRAHTGTDPDTAWGRLEVCVPGEETP